jgi:cytosine/adenosine deaminase-related metal-dependent hydrolase
LVTGVGAARLGWGETAGSLAPGRRADLVAVEDTGAATGRAEAVLAAAGRQVLTVLAGVQRARRASADVVWPPIDAQAWRDEGG